MKKCLNNYLPLMRNDCFAEPPAFYRRSGYNYDSSKLITENFLFKIFFLFRLLQSNPENYLLLREYIFCIKTANCSRVIALYFTIPVRNSRNTQYKVKPYR